MAVNPNLSDKAKRDYKLVEKAIKGDEQAYGELMEYYRDSIYFMILKMVSNESDAEDLTIEAFGKAFKNIGAYTPNYAFSTWLFKIATNNTIDFLRKKRNAQKHVSIDQQDDENNDIYIPLPTDANDPEESLVLKQREKLMRSVVSKLNPLYRRLIELRYFKEYSYIEIAEELNLPVGTVKARIHRSKQLLLNILKKENKDMI